MNRMKAGIFCLVVLFAACAFGQISGEVEAIGLGGYYRQECWTPMLVRIRPGAEDSGEYQVQIFQEDMDRDRAVYTRPVTLTGGAREQRFWCYFQPQPTKNVLNGKGLPDTTQGGNLANLQEQLRVYLCDAKGKQLVRLPVTSTITNIEPGGMQKRGVKLILFVREGLSQPVYREYADAIGVTEDVEFVPLSPRDLPEDPRGLSAVDGMVWAGAAPPDPSVPAEEPRMRAIQRWVRGGGKLVICQPPEWQRALVWGDLLPVTFPKIGEIQGVARKDDLYPLRSIATFVARGEGAGPTPMGGSVWDQPKGPFYFGVAEAKGDGKVDEWIPWSSNTGLPARTPYIVRRPYNMGETIWVAHDLGDPAITTRARTGWAYVWDRVFDWKNDLKIVTATTPEAEKVLYAQASGVDMGAVILEGTRLASTIAWLVGVAVTFFIGYWLLAGPGVYLYLMKVRRTGMSWVGFAVAAVAATALTLLVVRLVLRGAPEMRHVTLVKQGPVGPAIASSKVSLYVKRDGLQAIELGQTSSEGVSYVSPLAIHPAQLPDASEFAANLEYTVPVRDAGATEGAVGTRVPYRSTEKKLDVRWVGEMTGRITGAPALAPGTQRGISGKLSNATGQNLRHVWIAYNVPGNQTREGSVDILLYYPKWDDGTTIDLVADFPGGLISENSTQSNGKPEEGKRLWGLLGIQGSNWSFYFDGVIPRSGMPQDRLLDDWTKMPLHVFPQLSLFERLRPVKTTPVAGSFRTKEERFERLRRGGREWDVSGVVAGGGMVVLAMSQDDVALPYPLTVEGDAVAGRGTVFYQFAIPLDRSALDKAPVEPGQESDPAATQPATAGGGAAGVVSGVVGGAVNTGAR